MKVKLSTYESDFRTLFFPLCCVENVSVFCEKFTDIE